MDVLEVLKEISKNIANNGNENIALYSLIISILALVITIIFNIVTHRQYIKSLDPLLSFKLIRGDYALFLSITNTGGSVAKDIVVNIKEIYNNGQYNNLELDELSNKKMTLFPKETVQGKIAIYGENISTSVFPQIELDIIYKKGNDNKIEKYSRSVTYTNEYQPKIDLSKLEDDLSSIAYSNNRLANYIEGRCLFKFDKLNVFPNNSLYKDMKDAINNVERKEKIEEE